MPKERPLLLKGNSPLLNFYESTIRLPHPVDYAPCRYETVEHRFQACKGLFVTEGDPGASHDWVLMGITPKEAKERGRSLKINHKLWDRFAFFYMLEAQAEKFRQNKALRKELRKTAPRPLVEHRPDPIWGDNMDGTGKNLCGKSLVIVRDTIL